MLTDDMTRLCGEIVALRAGRGEMLNGLKRESTDRRESIAALCEQFSSGRAAMARQTKRERMSFLRSLRHAVHAQEREMQADLTGVRRAWTGRAA